MLDFLTSNPVARHAVLGFLFAVTVFAVFLIARVTSQRMKVRDSVRKIGQMGQEGARLSLREQRSNTWVNLTDRIEKAGLNLTDTNNDRLREKLAAAGFPSPAAPKLYTLIRLVLLFVLPLFYWFESGISAETESFSSLAITSLLLATLGLYLPNVFVRMKASQRKEQIAHGFPDCLDLMLVCVEAGLGLEAAMDRVGREMVTSRPLIANMLSNVTLELRAGARRDEALRRMGEASHVAEIRSFATLLIQSDKLGTSVADTLRVYSAEMREKRRMRAEEKAHRLPVLISIPLVVNMLPVMIGVLMIPGAIRMVREMLPALAGGGGG